MKKTDPILQANDENIQIFRPSVKRMEAGNPESRIFTIAADTTVAPGKKYIPLLPSKKDSFRCLEPPPSKSVYEVQRRQLKGTDLPKEQFNPITDAITRPITAGAGARKVFSASLPLNDVPPVAT